jgi:hypothetical protein
MPVGAVGSTLAAMVAFAASSFDEPVPVGGAEVAISLGGEMERREGERRV